MNTERVVPAMLTIHPTVLCRRQYPRHPQGCPNVRRCATVARNLHELAREPFRVFWVDFDLGAHVERMRTKHPAWSQAQLRNVFYWQGAVRAELRREVAAFFEDHDPSTYWVTFCPEIHGVDVTLTMQYAGVRLEWPVVETARVVALAGMSRRRSFS